MQPLNKWQGLRRHGSVPGLFRPAKILTCNSLCWTVKFWHIWLLGQPGSHMSFQMQVTSVQLLKKGQGPNPGILNASGFAKIWTCGIPAPATPVVLIKLIFGIYRYHKNIISPHICFPCYLISFNQELKFQNCVFEIRLDKRSQLIQKSDTRKQLFFYKKIL